MRGIRTIIAGAGQAALSLSYLLKQAGHEHVLFEQAPFLASAWRCRWDSFTLVTPNWELQLPGFPYDGDDPDGFLTRDEVIDYFERYARRFDPPVRFNVRTTGAFLDEKTGDYVVETTAGSFSARNLVVATGLYQSPRPPATAAQLPRGLGQLHTSQYRNPQALPPGNVLVVGSGQSGGQIAEELNEAGRKVYLCVGRSSRLPRRYRGSDSAVWLRELGLYDRTVEQLSAPEVKFGVNPLISGKNGGRNLSFQKLHREGVVLLGHLLSVHGTKLVLASDLEENLAATDRFAADFRRATDSLITDRGLNIPSDPPPSDPPGWPRVPSPREIDLKEAGITVVLWATGYTFDFSWVRLPVFGLDGYPLQKRGVTEYPGLCFLGLPWLHTMKSGLIYGAGEDAAYLVAQLER